MAYIYRQQAISFFLKENLIDFLQKETIYWLLPRIVGKDTQLKLGVVVYMDEIFLFSAPEIEQLLVENQIDLVKELREQGLAVERGFTSDPAKGKSSQSRDVALVIIASGITLVALSHAISKIIETLARRPVMVKEITCRPALDAKGNVIRQKNGEILMEWKEQHKMLEPTQPGSENQSLKAEINLVKGLQFELLNEKGL